MNRDEPRLQSRSRCAASLVEVLLAFSLVHVCWRSFKHFTWLGRAQGCGPPELQRRLHHDRVRHPGRATPRLPPPLLTCRLQTSACQGSSPPQSRSRPRSQASNSGNRITRRFTPFRRRWLTARAGRCCTENPPASVSGKPGSKLWAFSHAWLISRENSSRGTALISSFRGAAFRRGNARAPSTPSARPGIRPGRRRAWAAG